MVSEFSDRFYEARERNGFYIDRRDCAPLLRGLAEEIRLPVELAPAYYDGSALLAFFPSRTYMRVYLNALAKRKTFSLAVLNVPAGISLPRNAGAHLAAIFPSLLALAKNKNMRSSMQKC
jgi:hypothetical protein